MSRKRRLFYGPYFGEFGHELMGAAMARFQARRFEHTTACSRPAREALYTDFADQFVAHDIQCEGCCDGSTPETAPTLAQIAQFLPADPLTEVMRPTIFRDGMEKAAFCKYGVRRPAFADAIVFHCRTRGHVPMRNWPRRNWNRLARRIYAEGWADKIICVGTKAAAGMAEGAVDKRDRPLAEQMDVLASAKLVIGPSSGPMHLAQHCGAPVLVWCGGAEPEPTEVKARYDEYWNPHGAFAAAHKYNSWQPTYKRVLGWLGDALDELGAR